MPLAGQGSLFLYAKYKYKKTTKAFRSVYFIQNNSINKNYLSSTLFNDLVGFYIWYIKVT